MIECKRINYGIDISTSVRNAILNNATTCVIKGCRNQADKYLIAGKDKLFNDAFLRMKNREFIESHCFNVLALGICNKHLKELSASEELAKAFQRKEATK